MNRTQRDEAKARYAAARQSRSAAQAKAAEERARRESLIASAFGKRPVRDDGWAPPAVRAVLASKAPRLLDHQYFRALTRLAELPAIRPVAEWQPRGKGREALFRSLAAHLLARFPVPAIVWNAFHDDNVALLSGLAAHVAGGGSLYDLVKTGFPIPLTRKMCHDLLATSAHHRFLDAIRRVQARAAGADPRFFTAWRATRQAQQIGSREDETFWYAVVEWFAKQAMMEPAEIGPLFDYIAERRRQEPSFTMKGRSGLAMLRAMKEWHGNLTREKAIRGIVFPTSGFAPGDFAEWRRGPKSAIVHELWQIREVLSPRVLAEEGARMGHCVYSYAWRIEKGETSIWSVQMEDGEGETGRWHMVTLEVHKATRRIVQARGRFNRAVTSKELLVIRRWAGLNNLQISIGSW